MANLEGVREYNRIRRYLEGIYLYGFFSREDFARAGIGSVKDYDYGTKLIRSIFPETEEDAIWQDGHKYLRFQRAYEASGEMHIADSYLLAAMDVEDALPSLIGVLASIAFCARTIDDICVHTAIHTRVQNNLNYHTVRRWMTELVNYGYVEKRGHRYGLTNDPFEKLPLASLIDLYEYVCFAAGVTYPRVAGSFLKRTVERALRRHGKTVSDRSTLLLRHSVMRCVFDEEILYQIMDCIAQRRQVEIKQGGQCAQMQPVALRADTRLGRWYLLAMAEGKPRLLRISGITSVKKKACKDSVDEMAWEQSAQTCLVAYAHTGCSGVLPENGPKTVLAKLDFENMPGMRNQFEREMRVGELIDTEDGLYYQAEVNDPIELTSFLRSFSPWLTILPKENALAERVEADLKAMLAYLQDDGLEEMG